MIAPTNIDRSSYRSTRMAYTKTQEKKFTSTEFAQLRYYDGRVQEAIHALVEFSILTASKGSR
jgi:hypothetical protein